MANGSWREVILGAVAGLALIAAGVALRPPPHVRRPSVHAPSRPHVTAPVVPTRPAGPGAMAVAFVNARDGWAIVGGQCGYAPGDTSSGPPCEIVATTDGGARWTRVFQTTRALTRLDFRDPLHGFAAGPDTLLATADGGKKWAWQIKGRRPPSSVDLVTATEAWGISGGALVRSSDEGRSWSVAHGGSTCTFSSVSFAGPRYGWAAGSSAKGVCLYTTHDGGRTWTPLFERLSAGPAAHAFAAYAASLGPDPPSGPTLEARRPFPPDAVSAKAVLISPTEGWLVAHFQGFSAGAFAVMRTSDAGARWQYAWGSFGCLMSCGASGESRYPAFFLNGAIVWRLEPFGVARSTDGGSHWSGLPHCMATKTQCFAAPPPTGALCAKTQCAGGVTFVSAAIGWAATARGIFATRDGGKTWRQQWPPTLAATSANAPSSARTRG